MQFIVRIYYEGSLQSIDMSMRECAYIGLDGMGAVCVYENDVFKKLVKICKGKKGWTIKGKMLYTADGKRVFFGSRIEMGSRYIVKTTPLLAISIHPRQENSEKTVLLKNFDEITVGRGKENSIVFSNKITSKHHFRIYRDNKSYKIEDMNSRNGTYVNGKRIVCMELRNADIINFSVYHIIYLNGILAFFNVGSDMILNIPENKEEEADTERMLDITQDAYRIPGARI